jgi:hypothetical protein
MSIVARDDDRALIHQLSRETLLGRVIDVPAQRRAAPQVRWTVAAKADCLRLVELLDTSPLRGRKSADYAVWRAAVHWWVDGDPTKRSANRDWRCMAELAVRIKQLRTYAASLPTDYMVDAPGLKPDWLPYLSGFLTAEAHFGIGAAGNGRVRPTMRINVRADDMLLLAELARRTGTGRIYSYPRRRYERSRVASWSVFSAEDLHRLVGLVDSSPPRGRKGSEYAIWRRAALCVSQSDGSDQQRLHDLAVELRARRAYVPPAH